MTRIGSIVVAAVVLAACGGQGRRDAAVAEMRTSGWAEAEATCFVDGVIAEVGEDALDDQVTLSPDRLDALYRVSSGCRLVSERPLELSDPIGYGELTEQDLNNDPSAMTEEQILAWAETFGYDAGPLAADVAELRRQALDDLTVTRGMPLAEAQCVVDELYGRLGKAGLDLRGTPTPEIARAEADALAACTE